MHLKNSKIIVIKIGSSLLVDKNGKTRIKWLSSFAKDIKNLNSMGCYSNEGDKWRKSNIKFENSNTLLINITEKFIGERGRINCSLRDKSGYWRWLGIQFVISDK